MLLDPDMMEIAQIYIEESTEGLDAMESGLLNLDFGEADPETMNTIFRSAHSIKGGGATLGIDEIAEFAHHVETLLDEIRQGVRPVVELSVQVLLQSVDCIRDMITMLSNNEEIDTQKAEELEVQLEKILNNEDTGTADANTAGSDEVNSSAKVDTLVYWCISIKPGQDLFKSENDLLTFFRELKEIGELSVHTNGVRKLDFDNLSPKDCVLEWELYFKTSEPQEKLKELFKWLEAVGELTYQIVDHIPVNEDEGELGEVSPFKSNTALSASASENSTPDNSSPDSASLDNSVQEKNQQETDSGTGAPPASAISGAPTNAPSVDGTPVPSSPKKDVGKTGGAVPGSKDAKSKKKPAQKRPVKNKESGSIRVNIAKIDALINLVGELVITQSMLSRFNGASLENHADNLREGLIQLERNTRDLQESVMQIRMLPISFAFSRFPRLVHDTGKKLGKKVELRLVGEHTELDKTVLEKIGDPLVHLVRNSLDHGLETPDVRVASGKPETGIVELNAYHAGGNIIIEVTDDGAGINHEKVLQKARERELVGPDEELSVDRINNLIFMAGFSTAEQVSDLSGRGVGMDVVRRNIADLGGHVFVKSEMGKGSKFTIRLPLTLAILDGQLVDVGGQTFIISLISMLETTQITAEQVNSVAEETELFKLRDEYIPIVRLYDLFGIEAEKTNLLEGLLVIVEADGQRIGLLVDDVLEQQQVVIKSLESNFSQIMGISGATILGDGMVALIIDVPGLIRLFFEKQKRSSSQAMLA